MPVHTWGLITVRTLTFGIQEHSTLSKAVTLGSLEMYEKDKTIVKSSHREGCLLPKIRLKSILKKQPEKLHFNPVSTLSYCMY